MSVVWHRNDLRVHDNPALARAASDGGAVNPVFVVDPWFYREGSNCDARAEFVLSSVEALRHEYADLGAELTVERGESVPRVADAADRLGAEPADVYYNGEPNAGYPRERDSAAEERGFTAVCGDGIVRDGATRDGWKENAESWFGAETHDAPASLTSDRLEDGVTLDKARERYGIEPGKPVPDAGEAAAFERLRRFVERTDGYIPSISPPYAAEGNDGAGTSRLSPYFSVGSLSLRTAHRRVTEEAGGAPVDAFVERLFWNRHFTQKLHDYPELPRRAVNPVFRGMNRNSHDPERVRAWKDGETGYPLVDASMRALSSEGWMNFRMRAMVASFFTYILKQPWWLGARHMRRELIDGDTAINYAQWQMQSGLVGVHPNRIYNPTKQVRENDPDGRYTRKYVPELGGVPDEHIAEPWRMDEAVAREAGVRVGPDGDYPEPIVVFEEEARRAREAYAAVADRAREALSDPEVYGKASLPERRSRDELTTTSYPEPETNEQASLDDFS